MTRTTVIIPTYWTWASDESHRPVTGSYDHPTPLDGESTLPPLLEDLSKQKGADFNVLILAGLAHPDMSKEVSAHVRAMLKPYGQKLKLYLCDGPAWRELKSMLDLSDTQAQIPHLGSYSGIRNLQLLFPHILGAEVIIALDDDERVEPDYVKRALRYIGKTLNEQTVLGLAGPYIQRNGGILLTEPPFTGNVFLDKSRSINKAMSQLTASRDSISPSPMALGGNMLFHRDLFTQVCFDPGITRGEDIDYLINARLKGIRWWFDADLTILHLPPYHNETPPYQRTREDIFRFVYELEKLRLHRHPSPGWLDPYPGSLLVDDLPAHALSALEAQATPELITRFGDPRTILEKAQAHAADYAPRYAGFQRAWAELMARIEVETALRLKLAAAIPRL